MQLSYLLNNLAVILLDQRNTCVNNIIVYNVDFQNNNAQLINITEQTSFFTYFRNSILRLVLL